MILFLRYVKAVLFATTKAFFIAQFVAFSIWSAGKMFGREPDYWTLARNLFLGIAIVFFVAHSLRHLNIFFGLRKICAKLRVPFADVTEGCLKYHLDKDEDFHIWVQKGDGQTFLTRLHERRG